MSADDPSSDEGEEVPVTVEDPSGSGGRREAARERLGEQADRAVEGFDQGIVDLLSWILDTETRARIYVYLRKFPGSTSEEVAEGTGLYPSTVREALAELHEEGTVERVKRESEGAGNNPYEYTAIPPSDLVRGMLQQVQDELNTVVNLDRYLGREGEDADETEPISVSVDVRESSGEEDGADDVDDAGEKDESADDDGDDAGERT